MRTLTGNSSSILTVLRRWSLPVLLICGLTWLLWPAAKPEGTLQRCDGWPEYFLQQKAFDRLKTRVWAPVLEGSVLKAVDSFPPQPPMESEDNALWWRSGYALAELLQQAAHLGAQAAVQGKTAPTLLASASRLEQVVALEWLMTELLLGQVLGVQSQAMLETLLAQDTPVALQSTGQSRLKGLPLALKQAVQRAEASVSPPKSPKHWHQRMIGAAEVRRLLPAWQALTAELGCPYTPAGVARLAEILGWLEDAKSAPPSSEWSERLELNEPSFDSRTCLAADAQHGTVRTDPLPLAALATWALVRLEQVPEQSVQADPVSRLYRDWAVALLHPADAQAGLGPFCSGAANARAALSTIDPSEARNALLFGDFQTTGQLADALFQVCQVDDVCPKTEAPELETAAASTDPRSTHELSPLSGARGRLDQVDAWVQSCLIGIEAQEPEAAQILRDEHAFSGLARQRYLGSPEAATISIEAGCDPAGWDELYQFWGGRLDEQSRWNMAVYRIAWSSLLLKQERVGDAAKPVCDLALGYPLFMPVCELVRSVPTPEGGRGAGASL